MNAHTKDICYLTGGLLLSGVALAWAYSTDRSSGMDLSTGDLSESGAVSRVDAHIAHAQRRMDRRRNAASKRVERSKASHKTAQDMREEIAADVEREQRKQGRIKLNPYGATIVRAQTREAKHLGDAAFHQAQTLDVPDAPELPEDFFAVSAITPASVADATDEVRAARRIYRGAREAEQKAHQEKIAARKTLSRELSERKAARRSVRAEKLQEGIETPDYDSYGS